MQNEYMTRSRQIAIGVSLALGMATFHANGQTYGVRSQTEILQEAYLQSSEQFRRQSEELQRLENLPEMALQQNDEAIGDTLPPETPCFPVSELRLALPDQLSPAQLRLGASATQDDPFYFLRRAIEVYRGQCIGREGADLIVRRLAAMIYSQGYSTTRLVVPEQDLTSGTFTLILIPGVIRSISFSAPDMSGNWKSAFPLRPGDLLNVHDLEQGMEDVKKAYNEDVEMQIVPSDHPGESDIIIDVMHSDLRSLSAQSNAVSKNEEERVQATVNHVITHPLGASEAIVMSTIGKKERNDIENQRRSNVNRRIFDGELILSPDKDLLSHQEVNAPLGSSDQAVYAGLDLGRFSNPALQYLLGEKLAGAALGLRGKLNGANYDLYLGWAVYKAPNFRTNAQGIGFNLRYHY